MNSLKRKIGTCSTHETIDKKQGSQIEQWKNQVRQLEHQRPIDTVQLFQIQLCIRNWYCRNYTIVYKTNKIK